MKSQTVDLAGCLGKQRFENKHDAQKALTSNNRRKDSTLNTYRCPSCNGIHLGTNSRKH
jgi:hypothetical protein